MKHYLEHFQKIMQDLSVTEAGLSSQEAADRLTKYGPNKLKEGEKESLISKFLHQLADPITIILIVAAAISGVTAAYSGEGFADVIIIMAVVIINAVLGVYQESKAEAAIEALQEIAAATSKVIRNGHQITIKSEELVPGDVIVLEAGDSQSDQKSNDGGSLIEAHLDFQDVLKQDTGAQVQGQKYADGEQSNRVALFDVFFHLGSSFLGTGGG